MRKKTAAALGAQRQFRARKIFSTILRLVKVELNGTLSRQSGSKAEVSVD